MGNNKKKLVDNLCKDWTFDMEKLGNIKINVEGKWYSRKIYKPLYPELAYINFKGKRYYFDK